MTTDCEVCEMWATWIAITADGIPYIRAGNIDVESANGSSTGAVTQTFDPPMRVYPVRTFTALSGLHLVRDSRFSNFSVQAQVNVHSKNGMSAFVAANSPTPSTFFRCNMAYILFDL